MDPEDYSSWDGNSTFGMPTTNLTSDQIYETFLIKNYIIIALYVPVIMMAVAANTLVILVVIKYNFMRSVTNYFLVNLSVADLLVTLVCMPKAMWHSYSALWIFGEIPCKISNYLQCISVASSVFTITTMALDRYLAITRPFGFLSRCFNKKITLLVIAFLWTASVVIYLPIFIVSELEENDKIPNAPIIFCKENWESSLIPQQVFGVISFTTIFAVPGFIMLWAYSMMGRKLCSVVPPFDSNEGMASTQQSTRLVKERKRVAWILLLLAFVFFFCWLPYNMIILLLDTKHAPQVITDVTSYTLLLGHFNSALNPIIYCAMSRNFRRSVKQLVMRAVRPFGSNRRNLHWADSSRSSQRPYIEKLKTVPVNNPYRFNASPLQSSQKTTKTCAV